MVRRPMAEWHCILHDAYPPISVGHNIWPIRPACRKMPSATQSKGVWGQAPPGGAALLQGLATCGLCGHRMRVAYRPRPRYVCEGMYRTFAEPPCASRWAIDRGLRGPGVFRHCAPPTLDEVLAQRQREHHRLETYHQQQVSQARYEATLARRRYEHVDPAYRLAAAALEHEWDDKLAALPSQEAAERFANEPCEPTWTMEQRTPAPLSQRLPDLWQSSTCVMNNARPCCGA